jgi:hypothetical protein
LIAPLIDWLAGWLVGWLRIQVIQAPGLYQGYNPDVFPALSQAIREQNVLAIDLQQRHIALTIASAASYLCSGCV